MRIPVVAIVGGESLLGKEIREVLRESPLPVDLKLVGADAEEQGKITEEAGEAVVITALDESSLSSADAIVLAGTVESSRKAYTLMEKRRDAFMIDATRALEDLPSARLCAPLAWEGAPAHTLHPLSVIAHPAATALAIFFGRLEIDHEVTRALVEIFEPASERGQQGIDELHQQTMKLFSFQGLPKHVFDCQLAYNMLSAYGVAAPQKLEQIEMTIERHLASLFQMREQAWMPSLRLIQAPVFHGYSMSVWVEFDSATTAAALAAALANERVQLSPPEEEPPNNVGTVGWNGIALGNIRADRNSKRAFWFWLAADNLRLTAWNAVLLAQRKIGAFAA
jgi:aspartate-semialdehyde dehydrogenase